MKELGLSQLEVETWYGSFAPAGTPAPVIAKINAVDGGACFGIAQRGGGAGLNQVAELLVQNKLVINVQTFPFDRAAEAWKRHQARQ